MNSKKNVIAAILVMGGLALSVNGFINYESSVGPNEVYASSRTLTKKKTYIETKRSSQTEKESQANKDTEKNNETSVKTRKDKNTDSNYNKYSKQDTIKDNNVSKTGICISDSGEKFEAGKKITVDDIKVVNLEGTWKDMGRQYGYLMKEELEDVYTFLEPVFDADGASASTARNVVEHETDQTPYRISQFFEGVAETSGFTVDELQKINAVERVAGLPQCSVAMAWGDYAESDLVVGRNYDWSETFEVLKDDIAVTVYHPADGALATATIGYVGEIYTVNGLNEKGIFLELNNGTPTANIKSPSNRITGTTMLFECLFEADELSDMDLFFNTTNNNESYIINVADENQGQSFEWCPVGVKHGEESLPDGLLVSTNYYVNEDWLFNTPTDEASWSGITRRNNLIELCEKNKGDINEETMMDIIDTTVEKGGAKNEHTVYQLVVVPETKELWLQIAGGSSWTKVDLDSFLS